MIDTDQTAYESYQNYCLRLGFPPAPFDTWYRNRFGKARPMGAAALQPKPERFKMPRQKPAKKVRPVIEKRTADDIVGELPEVG